MLIEMMILGCSPGCPWLEKATAESMNHPTVPTAALIFPGLKVLNQQGRSHEVGHVQRGQDLLAGFGQIFNRHNSCAKGSLSRMLAQLPTFLLWGSQLHPFPPPFDMITVNLPETSADSSSLAISLLRPPHMKQSKEFASWDMPFLGQLDADHFMISLKKKGS